MGGRQTDPVSTRHGGAPTPSATTIAAAALAATARTTSEPSIREEAVGMPELLVRRHMRDLVVAVLGIHAAGVVHRDIKGSNVL